MHIPSSDKYSQKIEVVYGGLGKWNPPVQHIMVEFSGSSERRRNLSMPRNPRRWIAWLHPLVNGARGYKTQTVNEAKRTDEE